MNSPVAWLYPSPTLVLTVSNKTISPGITSCERAFKTAVNATVGSRIEQMSHVMRKPTFWFPTRSGTNQTVQPQKMARGLKFRIQVEEGLYYPYSENKDADQLRGHCAADFCICKKPVFS